MHLMWLNCFPEKLHGTNICLTEQTLQARLHLKCLVEFGPSLKGLCTEKNNKLAKGLENNTNEGTEVV